MDHSSQTPVFATSSEAEAEMEWPQPQYVTLSEVEVVPSSDALWSPPPREFSLPPAFMASHSTNVPQDTSSSSPPELELDQEEESKAASTSKNKKKKKKKAEPSSTLDDFWYKEGTTWSDLKPTKEEREKGRRKRTGIAGCETGPECYTCGTRLNLNEIFGFAPELTRAFA
ncbi:hypothetical protein F4677DRAFT_464354 [Hypoxylon crocopeplum]|nr:hypothetical protein F4677DRAFT_464354 [Hypoxylon crocopeplum]